MSYNNMKEEILAAGRITESIKKKYFFGIGVKKIRDTLEKMGLDRHMSIELKSTEIALITPVGILMQVRLHDDNKLGMWGGVLEDDEQPYYGCLRELKEETRLNIDSDKLKFIETNDHSHEYANGDKGLFHSYRYIIRLNYVPEIVINEESTGIEFVTEDSFQQQEILDHQRDYIRRILKSKI